jgi:hypothetical protein
LPQGANPGLLDNQRYDAVTIAAVRDDVPTLQALLAGGASAKLVTSLYDGTALIAAAHLGHDGVVHELIRAGAPLDHVNNLGWTALIEAVVLGDGGPRHTKTVRALVEAGADTLGLSEEAAHNLRAAAQSGTALARGLQEVSREVVDRSQKRLQRNLDGLQALARCRSMTDFVEVQSSLLRDNLEQTVENSRRLAELTLQMTEAASRTVTVQADKTAERVCCVA